MKAKEKDHFKQWIKYEDVLEILTDKLGIDINGIDEVSFELREDRIDGKFLVVSVKKANEKNLTWWQVKSNTDIVGWQLVYLSTASEEQKRKISSEVRYIK